MDNFLIITRRRYFWKAIILVVEIFLLLCGKKENKDAGSEP